MLIFNLYSHSAASKPMPAIPLHRLLLLICSHVSAAAFIPANYCVPDQMKLTFHHSSSAWTTFMVASLTEFLMYTRSKKYLHSWTKYLSRSGTSNYSSSNEENLTLIWKLIIWLKVIVQTTGNYLFECESLNFFVYRLGCILLDKNSYIGFNTTSPLTLFPSHPVQN